jgi:pantoate--beta-alanine ligase
MLREEGVDLVWTPTDEIMYGREFQTWVEVERLTKILEGAQRPEHFRGVTTVVSKLFNAVQPQKAYFGQKDAQQVVVIKRMTEDLNFPIEIVVCPTVREPDGLAMSSRNSYLESKEREAATALFKALKAAKNAFEVGTKDANELKDRMRTVLDTQPVLKVEYISVADPETLEESKGVIDRALFSMAVWVGKTRLIDNMIVGDQVA